MLPPTISPRRTARTPFLATALLAILLGAGCAGAEPVEVRDLEVPDQSIFETDDSILGPCSVVRIVSDRPSVGTDPVLGMIEVDPDRCVQRAIRRIITV